MNERKSREWPAGDRDAEGDLEAEKPGGLNQRNVDTVCFYSQL